MIYFDNAATGGFKPRKVADAAIGCIKYLSANPGRSGHRLSLTGAKIVYSAREKLCKFLGGSVPERVIFTKNCTEALNIAILGLLSGGGHVVTTVFEHNSVLRPLFTLKEKNAIALDVVSPAEGKTLKAAIEEKLKEDTRLVAVNHVSNVTGEQNDIAAIGKMLKTRNIPFLVDGAQSIGHIPVDMKEDNVSLLAIACHKGLTGIMGSGALLLGDDIELSPVYSGGTGTESFNPFQPSVYPERLEAGTLNLPAIAAIPPAVDYVSENQSDIMRTLFDLTDMLCCGLKKIDGVRVYSKPNPCGITSFSIENMPSIAAADILNADYDIAVRGGYHCAPLMHDYLGTKADGLIRASLSHFNTVNEVREFVSAIEIIASKTTSV